ncbi:MAG: NUDIX domain-containing protein [Bacillota bacterium]
MGGRAQKHEVSAGVVVFSGERVLVIRNRFDEWVLPKGKVEPGEALEAAALREVEEETGVRAEILCPAGRSEYTYCSDCTGDTVDKIVHWFLGRIEGSGGEPDPQARPQVEEGISAAMFVPWRDAVALLKYDGKLVEDAASALFTERR